MTTPINAHCKQALQYLMKLKEIEDPTAGHDPGDEDPNAFTERTCTDDSV